jgi:hypothetical protein
LAIAIFIPVVPVTIVLIVAVLIPEIPVPADAEISTASVVYPDTLLVRAPTVTLGTS